MNKFLSALLLLSFVLIGCARYNAMALSSLNHTTSEQVPAQHDHGIIALAKAFTKADCKEYLDRDVIRKGYQPIQLYIENTSDKTYLFSLDRISLTLASPEEVARKVHTSTIGRIVGYGVAAVIGTPFFIIPAIIDGMKSAKANQSLDYDFAIKAAKDQILYPHSHANMLLFVPKQSFQRAFHMTLIEERTCRPIQVNAAFISSYSGSLTN